MLQWNYDIEKAFYLNKINIGIQIFCTFAAVYVVNEGIIFCLLYLSIILLHLDFQQARILSSDFQEYDHQLNR